VNQYWIVIRILATLPAIAILLLLIPRYGSTVSSALLLVWLLATAIFLASPPKTCIEFAKYVDKDVEVLGR